MKKAKVGEGEKREDVGWEEESLQKRGQGRSLWHLSRDKPEGRW